MFLLPALGFDPFVSLNAARYGILFSKVFCLLDSIQNQYDCFSIISFRFIRWENPHFLQELETELYINTFLNANSELLVLM